MNRLVISTECPTCGAPLDFSEGSNAVTCGHCRSNLLVTGRRQILSYYVAPRLDERKASALAAMAQRNLGNTTFRTLRSQLYFIPYYRMTGQDFGWEEPAIKPVAEEDIALDQTLESERGDPSRMFRYETTSWGDNTTLFEAAGELLGDFFKTTFTSKVVKVTSTDKTPLTGCESHTSHMPLRTSSQIKRASLYEKGEVTLNDRYIEKNFLACDMTGVGLYSLGIRPAVLKLELLRKEAVGETGRLVCATLAADAALEVGTKTATNPSLLYRQVIGKVLSIIYFPFWVHEMESRGRSVATIIDAVAQTVIRPDAPTAIYKALECVFTTDPKIIGFRPLTCPNCGWDFPVRPDDTIFFCNTCKKAWELFEQELREIAFEVFSSPGRNSASQVQHLPFWIVASQDAEGKPFRYYIPAFRYRRLKMLLDLALSFSRIQPKFSPSATVDDIQQNLSGCYYDSRDAIMLAQFTDAALKADNIEAYRAHSADSIVTNGVSLAWIPFEVRGPDLVAPFAQICIPRNLLL